MRIHPSAQTGSAWLPALLLAFASACAVTLPAHAADTTFYGDPDTKVARWLQQNPTHPQRSAIAQRIGSQPMARWVGGGSIRAWVKQYVDDAAQQQRVPIVVAYNIPQRDCSQWSAGGAENAEKYRAWLRNELVPAFGQRKAVLILEPDSLIHLSCLDETSKSTRLRLLSEAVTLFKQRAPNTQVYLDGGDGYWNRPETLAPALVKANVANARGFAVNVSNYNATADITAFGVRLQQLLRDHHGISSRFVIDTSRNGAGAHPSREWCNPPDRRLGEPARLGVGSEPFDALLWIKTPGTSDGNCGIGLGTASGEFYPSMAQDLMK